MRRCTKLMVIAVAAGAWLIASHSAFADEPSAAGASPVASPPIAPVPAVDLSQDETELSAWFSAAKPRVELLAGETFRSDVAMKVISQDELAAIIAIPMREELLRTGANKRPDGKEMSELEITVRTRSAAYKIASRTFGLYSYRDKVVYVVPQNAELVGKKRAWEPQTIRRLVRLTIAHELVHALQDQVSEIGERTKNLDAEPARCLSAVAEGHAVTVTDALAKELSWETANSVLWGLVTGVREESKPGDVAAHTHGAPDAEVYVAGASFVRAQQLLQNVRPSGNARMWAILKRPPERWEQLKEPAAFHVDPEPLPVKEKPASGQKPSGDKP